MARRIERIVWHTAAHGRNGQAFDTTAAQIDQWHRERGWSEIGYNVVIRFDGTIEQGRDPRKIPAGVAGINETTYHICFSGHGDIAPLTPQQLESGIQHTIQMLHKYGLVERFLVEPDGLIVMGHREVNELVRRGLAPTPTTKTCPGRLVDMEQVRLLIRQRLQSTATVGTTYDAQAASELYHGLRQVYVAAAKLRLPDEVMHFLNQFRKQPEVDALIARWKREAEQAQ
ncbi:MAG: N-acetylmuramoyl-L-alanine amidase [Fimbriimonadales bacterium]|nr:N-acetylmuramoyl-L-alanine amidase [Fimbriimonadales bacterium]MDW8051343.1 N-acetylmuramoyl-L-alanine amidase [Armatimonadota bacterium]